MHDKIDYQSLGLRRVINAADTYTVLGGGALPEVVTESMIAAASTHVDVPDLLDASGRYLASLTHNPAALVVNGASAGLAISTAATVRARKMRRGRSDCNSGGPEVLALCCQRTPFDRAVGLGGARLREVGYAFSSPWEEIVDSITVNTVALLWVAGSNYERFAPDLESWIDLGRSRGLPVIVDAAAQVPPYENLWSYTERGASIAIFSGGKGLRGPQCSGLLVGSKEIVSMCRKCSYPFPSVGRSMKTSKECIMGLVAAVARAVNMDWDQEYSRLLDITRWWQQELENGCNVRTRIDPRGRSGQMFPRTFVSWESGWTASSVVNDLLLEDPSIRVELEPGADRTIILNPFSLQHDEEKIVLDSVKQAVTRAIDGS